MIEVLTSLATLALAGVGFGVAAVAGRRLYLSRSRNTLLYAAVCGYAAITGGAAAGVVSLGGAADPAAGLLALGSLPLWLAARIATDRPRGYGTAPLDTPVFRSTRVALRGRAASLT